MNGIAIFLLPLNTHNEKLIATATFLALTQNFMDVDTVVPAMMIDAGGTSVHIGLLTAILVGGSKLSQLFFAPFLSGGFANINYTDILGKSVLDTRRKRFFSVNQIVSSLGVLVSAFFARRILRTQAYPDNYAWLFFIAAALLGLASLGFWRIREVVTENLKIRNITEFFRVTRNEFRSSKRLLSYLLLKVLGGVIT